MSVVVNTNNAATAASNHLNRSNAMLQRSLNRLSSGSKIVSPSDDAGGLAVSMKMQAAIKRTAATNQNIGNARSLLEVQDKALSEVGKVLDRIGELKVLSQDVTKSQSDRSNYNIEYQELGKQLDSIKKEAFNDIPVFGPATHSVSVNNDSSESVEIGGIDLASALSKFPISEVWEPYGTSGIISSGTYSGPVAVDFNYSNIGATNKAVWVGFGTLGVGSFFNLSQGSNTGIQAVYDGQLSHSIHVGHTHDPTTLGPGNYHPTPTHLETYISPVADGYKVRIESVSTASENEFSLQGGGIVQLNDGSGSTPGNLEALELSDVSDALQEIAGFRAKNGAQQSRLQFAADQLTTNQANLEAANSRIVDVDVAEESTQLARYNILVQAGAAMLGQANASSQVALKLLG